MLKSRCGELGASLIDCSEGERACVCERETEREERERVPSGCEGKLGVALESLQGRRDLT